MGQNCTKGQICTKIILPEDKFAGGDKIAQGQLCTSYNFFGGSFLHKSKKDNKNICI